MGDGRISGLFRLSHGSLVGHQLSSNQRDPKSLTALMQPDLGDIVWVSLRALLLQSGTTHVTEVGPAGNLTHLPY